MFELMKLENKKNSLKVYVIASFLIFLMLLFFTYLFVVISILEQDEYTGMFYSYSGITKVVSTISMCTFAFIASAMYSKVVIEEYSLEKAILLLSYPVSRKKILGIKLIYVFVITALLSLTVNIINFGIFYILEYNFSLLKDELTIQVVKNTFFITLLFSCMAGVIGIISTRIGFINKSIVTTMISTVIIVSFLSNIFINMIGNIVITTITLFLIIVVGFFIVANFFKVIEKMEIE